MDSRLGQHAAKARRLKKNPSIVAFPTQHYGDKPLFLNN